MKLILGFTSEHCFNYASDQLAEAITRATGDRDDAQGYYDQPHGWGLVDPYMTLPGMANKQFQHKRGWSGEEKAGWYGWTRSSGTVLAWNESTRQIILAGYRHSLVELLPQDWLAYEWRPDDRVFITLKGTVVRVDHIKTAAPISRHPLKPAGRPETWSA